MANNPLLLVSTTNRESFNRIFVLSDADTGMPLELMYADGTILVDIRFEIVCSGQKSGSNSYTPWYDYGWLTESAPVLAASVGNGITIVDRNSFLVYFSETQMRSLSTETFDVGCVISEIEALAEFSDDFSDDFSNSDIPSPDTRQLFRGRLPVLDGYVTT